MHLPQDWLDAESDQSNVSSIRHLKTMGGIDRSINTLVGNCDRCRNCRSTSANRAA